MINQILLSGVITSQPTVLIPEGLSFPLLVDNQTATLTCYVYDLGEVLEESAFPLPGTHVILRAQMDYNGEWRIVVGRMVVMP